MWEMNKGSWQKKKIAAFNVSFQRRSFFQALSNTGGKQAPGVTLMRGCFIL